MVTMEGPTLLAGGAHLFCVSICCPPSQGGMIALLLLHLVPGDDLQTPPALVQAPGRVPQPRRVPARGEATRPDIPSVPSSAGTGGRVCATPACRATTQRHPEYPGDAHPGRLRVRHHRPAPPPAAGVHERRGFASQVTRTLDSLQGCNEKAGMDLTPGGWTASSRVALGGARNSCSLISWLVVIHTY